ncbi:hypothetical protein B0H19DRAFT_1082415 [Mycena capillaripes]|nr:hypothetical protein B0H19DRAFT_1082415 [Mycena capillaripes]
MKKKKQEALDAYTELVESSLGNEYEMRASMSKMIAKCELTDSSRSLRDVVEAREAMESEWSGDVDEKGGRCEGRASMQMGVVDVGEKRRYTARSQQVGMKEISAENERREAGDKERQQRTRRRGRGNVGNGRTHLFDAKSSSKTKTLGEARIPTPEGRIVAVKWRQKTLYLAGERRTRWWWYDWSGGAEDPDGRGMIDGEREIPRRCPAGAELRTNGRSITCRAAALERISAAGGQDFVVGRSGEPAGGGELGLGAARRCGRLKRGNARRAPAKGCRTRVVCQSGGRVKVWDLQRTYPYERC